jgi:DNA topoisomerase-2
MLETMAESTVDKDGKKVAPIIRDFLNESTDKIVKIRIVFPKGDIDKLHEESTPHNEVNGIEKLLKLTTTVSNTNMHLFRADLKLHKYETIGEIIDDFMTVRLLYYEKRKRYLIAEMEALLLKLSNRAKYIVLCLEGKIDLRRKTDNEINTLLVKMEFDIINDSFDYLIKMPMNSVSVENVNRILKERDDVEIQLKALMAKSIEMIWIEELDTFERQYDSFQEQRIMTQKGGDILVKKTKQPKKLKL